MNWIERIITKFKIEENAKFLIIDKKGILSSSAFLEYLKSKSIEYQFVEALSQLSSLSNSDFTGIIFSGINTIPAAIKNKFTNIEVSSFSLPFDISEKVYNLISVDEYIQLANYITESDISSKIDKKNYEARYGLGLLYHEARNLRGATIQYSKIPTGFKSQFFDFELKP